MQLDGKWLDGFTSDRVAITKESLVAEGNVIFGKCHFCILKRTNEFLIKSTDNQKLRGSGNILHQMVRIQNFNSINKGTIPRTRKVMGSLYSTLVRPHLQ